MLAPSKLSLPVVSLSDCLGAKHNPKSLICWPGEITAGGLGTHGAHTVHAPGLYEDPGRNEDIAW